MERNIIEASECDEYSQPEPSRPIVHDNGDFYNVEVGPLTFTADKISRDWGMAPTDNHATAQDAADQIGYPSVSMFWRDYEPMLNELVGW